MSEEKRPSDRPNNEGKKEYRSSDHGDKESKSGKKDNPREDVTAKDIHYNKQVRPDKG